MKKTKRLLSTLLFIVIGITMYSQAVVNWPGGMWALSCDANQHDKDDYGATPMAIALMYYAGLTDQIVHINHSNHMGNNNASMEAEITKSTEGGANRFGPVPLSKVFNCQDGVNAVRNHFLAQAQNANSSNPLWYVCAGPMEIPWQCLDAVRDNAPGKLQYIHCVSHSTWNEKHSDAQNNHTWANMKNNFPQVTFHDIIDQNKSNGDFDWRSPLPKWHWLRDSPNPNWRWLYNRNVKPDYDVSDAGMTYWLISGGPNGGNDKAGWREAKDLFENGGPTGDPTANAGPDQTVSDADGNGSEVVSLDGSGSTDPDGTITSYVWTEGGIEIASGITPNVTLVVGTHNITLTVTDNDGKTDTDQLTITVTGISLIPGKVEAEDYCSQSGVQTEPCSEGGLNVGWIDTGDWMDYCVDVQSTGQYNVEFRVAARSSNIKFDLIQGSTVLCSVDEPATGGWQTWTSVTKTITLSAGEQTLRVLATGGGWNFNYMDFIYNPTTSYTITATAGINGSITPSGAVEVNEGADQSFIITADPGYAVADVVVDGASVGAVTSYTFTNVTVSHTISASFVESPVDYVFINHNSSGYRLAVNGGNPASVVGTTTSDAAQWELQTVSGIYFYVINKSSGQKLQCVDGTVIAMVSATNTGDDVQWYWVDAGDGWFRLENKSFVRRLHLKSDGVTQLECGPTGWNGNNTKWGSEPVSTVATYTIDASAGANGSITPSGLIVVNEGAAQSFTITADPGYEIADVLVDGASVGAVTSYTFTNVTADHSISVSFVEEPSVNYVFINHNSSGYRLAVNGGNPASVVGTTTSDEAQWELQTVSGAYFYVINKSSGQKLQCVDGTAIAMVSATNTGDDVLWYWVDALDGWFRLENKSFVRRLHLKPDGVTQLECGPTGWNGNNTKWNSEPVSTIKSKSMESLSSIDVNVYPNPANELFTVELTGYENAAIVITDINGRMIRLVENVNEQHSFNTTDMNKGLYFIQVTDSNNADIQKIIIR